MLFLGISPPLKAGSVAPLFRAQIAAGDPITLTHTEVTRYFMTIPEAAQLVIQSSAMTVGGGRLRIGYPLSVFWVLYPGLT